MAGNAALLKWNRLLMKWTRLLPKDFQERMKVENQLLFFGNQSQIFVKLKKLKNFWKAFSYRSAVAGRITKFPSLPNSLRRFIRSCLSIASTILRLTIFSFAAVGKDGPPDFWMIPHMTRLGARATLQGGRQSFCKWFAFYD